MKHIYDIVSSFGTLKEYAEFMEQLVEKSASGDEISRGMNQHDKSKKEKTKTFVSKEVKKHANGGATEKHYQQSDPNLENPAPPPEEPAVPLQPGQQVNIGNKQIDQQAMKPKTVPIDISGEKDKINLNPNIPVNPRTQMR